LNLLRHRQVRQRLLGMQLVLALVAGSVAALAVTDLAHAGGETSVLAIAPPRTGVVKWNGGLSRVKEGDLGAGWVDQIPGTIQIALAGDRIAVLRGDRVVFAKEGPASSTGWLVQDTGGLQVALAGNRIGVLRVDGTLVVKEGLSPGWLLQEPEVAQFVLTGSRVVVLKRNGQLMAKDGPLDAAPWVVMDSNVQQVSASGNRIGVVRFDGSAWAKEGDLFAPWVFQGQGITQIAVSGDRLGLLVRRPGFLLVKEGDIAGTNYVPEEFNVTSFVLAGNRIGVLRADGNVSVKEGGLGAPWVFQDNGISQFTMSTGVD
jgi:hypothetical protein